MKAVARALVAFFCALGLCSCAGIKDRGESAANRCHLLLEDFERYVQAQHLPPRYPMPVAARPSLGTTRLLASVNPSTLSESAVEDWLSRLARAGRQRRDMQWSSLAVSDRARLAAKGIDDRAALESCADQRVAALAADRQSLRALQVSVPDAYLTTRRALGLYALTSLPVRLGIRDLHRETRETFATPLAALPRQGTLLRLYPKDPMPPEGLPKLPRDSLGPLPQKNPQVTALYLARHAPIWEIDVAGRADRPGAPRFADAAHPAVDSEQLRVYSYPSLTRFEGRWLLQLNYVIWFAERPPRGPLDTLAGDLDGLQWRVTLDEDGVPLIYDSIHPCGCYHLFFPTPRLALRPQSEQLPEPPLAPQVVEGQASRQRMVLRIASGTHYLQRAGYWNAGAVEAQTYSLSPYEALFRVPAESGPRSLFARHGLVPGSERAERFYLWPMGIRSPGAMRERGVQATAFLGRRHFDDPDLFDRLFQRVR